MSHFCQKSTVRVLAFEMSSQAHRKTLRVRDAVPIGNYLAMLINIDKDEATSVALFDEDDRICFRSNALHVSMRKFLFARLRMLVY